MNGLALCAAVGGLERGIESIIPSARTVCYVEGETYPASVLASKMEAGSLPKAPIWSNVRTFDGEAWRGKVSFISGGFPCQPYSTAGKQLADKDPRDLWPDFARIIGEVRPHFIFLENVPNVVKWALPTILKDLSQMGYDAAWCVVAACEVGAPHKRSRWFLFAHANDSSEYVMRFNDPQSSPQEFEGNDISNPNRERWDKNKPNLWSGQFNVEGGGEKIRNSNGNGLQKYPIEESCQGIFSQGKLARNRPKNFGPVDSPKISNSNSKRTERSRNKSQQGQILQRHINEEGFKFAQLGSWWEVEPRMGRMVDGVADWVHRMRACGNGVVPQQAAYAYSILMERCGFKVSRY